MKKTIKRLFNLLIIICLSIILLSQLSFLTRPSGSYRDIDVINTLHNFPKDSIEVMGLGPSTTHRSIIPFQLYEDYGIGSFNFTGPSQGIDTTLLYLKDMLIYQHPKVILISTYKFDTAGTEAMNFVKYSTKFLDSSVDKTEYLKNSFGSNIEGYVSYYFPLWSFHGNWTKIKKNAFREKNNYNILRNMGYKRIGTVEKIQIAEHSEEQIALPDYSIQCLEEITEICHKEQIELVLFSPPCGVPNLYSDYLYDFALNNNITYLDLTDYLDQLCMDENKDFSDDVHTNNSGAAKVTDFIGKYLTENYDLTDMRTV
ncbi:MAG: hypothetical protein Q4C42_07750, partial [Clostridia bacterium]|nr:hypothetical protein [Clostridia bacterium]